MSSEHKKEHITAVECTACGWVGISTQLDFINENNCPCADPRCPYCGARTEEIPIGDEIR
ncbi:hypothetical protein [Desulfonema magnum]|uniref:Uncharacterized protein n=1 Tax=Desulfonema magnum TaxID=45655 RepID=A0A975BF61_9BACT|nr:hypothetical protein [Desulfonema magnum]QTA84170.1 Uncharacterized protein dnm_001630 [Desulfonema magnum]